ncbi:hypothetical protein CBR_g12907 [Chara braunii]|uniref:Peptidase C14 caspase domain-containing protein n=1 Tax=Chara braunii TaxID=69332 RepID=A0A388KT21_CHABU|nr:hypothetical protein CBR_g12907 [Chara braunii]|eukprot:GBG73189.1 hypothetical protein CBR_g12907 [Chara braunii]
MARRALLIGASYGDNSNLPTLHGAVNDVVQAKTALTTVYGFAEAEVCVLADGEVDASCVKACTTPPTKACILAALDWLVKGACAGDVLFFHFSGYGTRVPSASSCDSLDEALLPSDATVSDVCGFGNVVDHGVFSSKFACIPKGVTVVQVFDTAFKGAAKCALAGVQHSVLCHGLSTKVVSARGLDNVPWLTASRKLNAEGRFACMQFPLSDVCKALYYDLPSAWLACAEEETTWDVVVDCKPAGIFSHHLYSTVVSQHKNELQNQNVCILNSVMYALSLGGFKHKPEYVVAADSKKLATFLPPAPEKECPPGVTDLQKFAIACLKKEALCKTDEALIEQLATRVALLTTITTVERQCLSQRLVSLVNARGHWILREMLEVCAPVVACSPWIPCHPLVPCAPQCLPRPSCPPCPPAVEFPPCIPGLDSRQLYFITRVVSYAKSAVSACRIEELAKRIARCSGYGLTLAEQQTIVDELTCLIQEDGWALLRLLFASEPPADLKFPEKKVQCPPPCSPVCPSADCNTHLRKLVSLMGVEGYEIGLKFKNEYACLSVEQRNCHYQTLYVKGGMEAVTTAAAIAGDACYIDVLAAAVGEHVRCAAVSTACCPPLSSSYSTLSASLKCQLLQSVVSAAGPRGHEIVVRLADCALLLEDSEKKTLYVELVKLGGVSALAAGARLAADVALLKTVVAAGERVRLVRGEPPVDLCARREARRQREKQLLKEVIVIAGCAGYEFSVQLMQEGLTVACRKEIYSKLFAEGGVEAVAIAALVSEDEIMEGELEKAGVEHATFVQSPAAIMCLLSACCPLPVPPTGWECDYLLSAEERRVVSALCYLAREDCTVRSLATKLALEKKVLSAGDRKSLVAQIVSKTGCEGLDLVQSLCC